MQKYKLFIGIDISKKWIDVCLPLKGNKKQMPHIQVENTPKGFMQMIKWIREQLKSLKKTTKLLTHIPSTKEWLFCMEHTGIYTFPLTQFLEKKNLDYVMVNPLHLKHSLGLRRVKNDKADAADIAKYILLHHQEHSLTNIPSDNLLKIKHLLGLRGRLIKSQNALTTSSNELKKHTPTVHHKEVVEHSKSHLKHLKKTIGLIEKQMLQAIEQDDELKRVYELVTSVKGAGLILGASLLVYTVGFTAFENSRQFATYIGIAPFARQSGSSLNSPAKVSHLAHKKLKGVISCGAASAMRYDKQLKAYAQRKIEEGKNKFAVQNAVRNKFLHRIFAVVKRGTPYVELHLHTS